MAFALNIFLAVFGLLLVANASQIGRGRTGLVCKLLPRAWQLRGSWLVASDAAWMVRLVGLLLVICSAVPIMRILAH